MKNFSTQLWETEEENRTRESIDEKPLNQWEKRGKKTQKS